MNRRTLLMSGIAALTLTATGGVSFAAASVDYKEGVVKKALAEGKTLFVEYTAPWCPTCRVQDVVIKELRSENPQFEKLTFVKVDWDSFKRKEISTAYRIPRQSTLLVLKGDQELGRVVAGTSKAKIKSLMETGLAAATA